MWSTANASCQAQCLDCNQPEELNLVGSVHRVESIVQRVLQPPRLPHSLHTGHPFRTLACTAQPLRVSCQHSGALTKLRSVHLNHPCPVARVGTSPDTAGNLVQVDRTSAGRSLLNYQPPPPASPYSGCQVDTSNWRMNSKLLELKSQPSKIFPEVKISLS